MPRRAAAGSASAHALAGIEQAPPPGEGAHDAIVAKAYGSWPMRRGKLVAVVRADPIVTLVAIIVFAQLCLAVGMMFVE